MQRAGCGESIKWMMANIIVARLPGTREYLAHFVEYPSSNQYAAQSQESGGVRIQ